MTNRPTSPRNALAGTASTAPTLIDENDLLSLGPISQPSTEQQNQSPLKGADTTEDEVLDVIGSGGMPLDFSIQRKLGERMDADFSDVRIHTGGKAAQAAESIDAKAFTCGNAIVFNSGEYDPRSADGQHLLAHELAHVKQQHGGAPLSMKPKSNADLEIDPDPQLEREADEAATEALAGEPLTINRMGAEIQIQRSTDDGAYTPSQIKKLVGQELGKKNIDSRLEDVEEEIKDVKGTVNNHDERLSNLENGPIDVNLEETAEGSQSLTERLQNAVTNLNPLDEKGAKNATEGLVASGLASAGVLATVLSGGTVGAAALTGIATATVAPMLRGAASDGIVGDNTSVPDAIAGKLGTALADSEEFAERLGKNPALAKKISQQLNGATHDDQTGDNDSRGLSNSTTGGD
ncbi:DUF4157 domain-containing protein [Natrinema pallidum]|uniref:eCIS core domain-containing protein n=1 Tax=Natrinema pallidum TaxID=69527 RepID=UPI001EE86513|nr:DUF4157 domain-containing protein [Natrinema pallidum]